MAKTYGVAFSATDPRTYPSLAPTFLSFRSLADGSAVTPPGITQIVTGSGLYNFFWTPTLPIYFLLDGITTTATDRYVFGILDPAHIIDEAAVTLLAIGNTNIAIGTTAVALGNSNIAIGTSVLAASITSAAISSSLSVLTAAVGSTTSTFGDSASDPGTLYGYLKRIQEFLEGRSTFTKATGSWAISSRGGSLLATKTLTNTSSQVTKL